MKCISRNSIWQPVPAEKCRNPDQRAVAIGALLLARQ
jgi:hypothetical protein